MKNVLCLYSNRLQSKWNKEYFNNSIFLHYFQRCKNYKKESLYQYETSSFGWKIVLVQRKFWYFFKLLFFRRIGGTYSKVMKRISFKLGECDKVKIILYIYSYDCKYSCKLWMILDFIQAHFYRELSYCSGDHYFIYLSLLPFSHFLLNFLPLSAGKRPPCYLPFLLVLTTL